jgi:hypothetical protein
MHADALLDTASGVRHEWTVTPRGASTAVELTIAEIGRDFADSMARGAFGAIPGARPVCALADQDPTLRGEHVRWRYDVESCDVRYARTLRNCLFAVEQIEELQMTLRAVQSRPTTASLGLTVDAEAVERGDFYSRRLASYPFEVRDEDTLRADKNRRVLVEYPVALDDAVEAALADVVARWRRIAEFGYPSSEAALTGGDCGILGIQGAVFDEMTYEITTEAFASSEAAWTSLLGLLAWMPESLRGSAVIIE